MYIDGIAVAFWIEAWTEFGISAISVLLAMAGLLHCAFQRPTVFPAVSALTKGVWLALLAGGALVSMLGMTGARGLMIFALIGLVAALVYLLDVRPAIRDLGTNPW